MMNNYYNNMYQGVGYGYNNMQRKPVGNNPLTDEEIKYLAQKSPAFSLTVSKDQQLQAICTHRDPKTGMDTLRRNQDGSVTCTLCGKTFNLLDIDQKTADQIVDNATDLMNTIKVIYQDIPNEVTRQVFALDPFLDKMKGLFKIGNEHFTQYSGAGTNPLYGTGNAAALLAGMMNGGMGMGMGMPMGQPQPGAAYYGQNMAPNMGMPMGQPQPGMAPNMNMQQQPPVQPAPTTNVFDANAQQPTTSETVTDNKTYQL